jgi:hypothetical protein
MSLAFKQIDSRDKTITPFKVHKSWEYTSLNAIDSSSIKRLVAIKPDGRFESGHILNTPNSQSLYWYNLNHLYYSNSNPFYVNNTRPLYLNAAVISIPQKQIGEGIKPGSFSFNYVNNSISSRSIALQDDGKGNIIDTALSASISNEILNINFATQVFDSNYISPVSVSLNSIPNDNNSFFDIVKAESNSKQIVAEAKNTYIAYRSGYYSLQPTNGYIRVSTTEDFNFVSDTDFCLSFWMYKKDNVAGSYVVSNRSTAKTRMLSKGKIVIRDFNQNVSKYPFDVYFSDANTLKFSSSDGSNVSTLTVSCTNGVEENLHILYQKKGSKMQLYVNGIFIGETDAPVGNLNNETDIFFGSLGLDSSGNAYNGTKCGFADIFIFEKSLNSNEVLQLSTRSVDIDMTTNRNTVGNIFYEHGQIVISDPRKSYDSFNTGYLFNDIYPGGTPNCSSPILKWNSTVTLYEHEYICKIREDEFNSTSNSTVRSNNIDSSDTLKAIVTDKSFTPYITTVGLYNDKGDLLVVGKLGTPIKKRDDVQLNIITRFDI